MSTLKTIKLQNPSGTSSNIDLGVGGEVLIGSATTTGTASQRLQVTGGGYFSGSVGIGYTLPGFNLSVNGSGYFNTTLVGTTILAATQTQTGTASQPLQVNGGAYVSGNLGVGATNPSVLIQVNSALENNTTLLGLYNSNTLTPTEQFFVSHDLNHAIIGNRRSGSFKIYTNNSERVCIDSSGSVGIGITNPGEKLHIGQGRLRLDEGYQITWLSTAGTQRSRIYGDSGGNFVVETGASNTERLRISSAGDIGIGQASGGEKLKIYQSGTSRVCSAISDNASFGELIYFCSANRSASTAFQYFQAYNASGTPDVEFRLMGDGNAYADGSWNGGGADYAEMFEWEDGNPDNEDRRGYSVSLVGNKIKIAQEGDEIIGVISGNPTVIGDAAWNKWSEKYLRDDFGSYITETHNVVEWTDEDGKEHSYEDWNLPEDVVVPADATIKTHDDKGNRFTHRKLNPEYNPDLEYVSREDRPEWDAVGMMGKLRLRKGQPVRSTWIKMRDISASVEEWLVR